MEWLIFCTFSNKDGYNNKRDVGIADEWIFIRSNFVEHCPAAVATQLIHEVH